MKKQLVFAAILCCAIGLGFLLRPKIKLFSAKIAAMHNFDADRKAWLSHVPVPITNVVASTSSVPTVQVELSDCVLALPSSEFKQDPAHKTVFTNDRVGVGFFGAVDPKEFASLEQKLGKSNVFDLTSSAYHANIPGILSQTSQDDLRHYLGLIDFKEKTGLANLDHSFLEFDRGDIKGFIGGTFQMDKKVVFEIYVRKKDQFLSGVVKAANPPGDMNDVYHVLSVLSVTIAPPTNNASSGN